MTIVTKPKNEKKLEKPLVGGDIACQDGECTCVVENGGTELEAWVSSSTSRRRISTATTICVCLTALLIISVGIIGGVYLYRQFSRHQMSRFRVWCGIPYERESLRLMGTPKLPFGAHASAYKGDDEVTWNQPKHLFKEEMELDLEDQSYEDIRVPDFGIGQEGRFFHDFKTNLTGILDERTMRCYVMPLNRTHILPPRDLYVIINKIWMGYYNNESKVVRESTRVIYPPIEDYTPLGIYITHQCSSYPTHRLQLINVHEIKKRSVDSLEQEGGLRFIEFAGKNIIDLTIYDEGEEQ